MPSDDQEVTKAVTSVCLAATQTMAPVMEAYQDVAPVRLQPSELTDGSLMSSQEMEVFASFCADSGASEELVELTKIQGELSSRREGAPNATRESYVVAPWITISGRNAREPVLEGMRHLDKELSDREASIAKAAKNVKKLIERGMNKLNRLSDKMMSVLISAEGTSVENQHFSDGIRMPRRESRQWRSAKRSSWVAPKRSTPESSS